VCVQPSSRTRLTRFSRRSTSKERAAAARASVAVQRRCEGAWPGVTRRAVTWRRFCRRRRDGRDGVTPAEHRAGDRVPASRDAGARRALRDDRRTHRGAVWHLRLRARPRRARGASDVGAPGCLQSAERESVALRAVESGQGAGRPDADALLVRPRALMWVLCADHGRVWGVQVPLPQSEGEASVKPRSEIIKCAEYIVYYIFSVLRARSQLGL
jgi:hypothetical protein